MRKNLYWAVFFLNIALAFSAYTNSLFLTAIGGEHLVGPVYAISSLVLLGALAILPAILRSYPRSLKGLSIAFLAGKIAAIILLAKLHLPLGLVIAFIIYDTLGYLARFNLDLYLEHSTNDSETGRVRGLFLTFTNLAWFLSPFLVGTLLGQTENYRQIYILAGLALLPAVYLISTMRTVTVRPVGGKFFLTVRKIFRHRNNHYRQIYHILSIDFLLNFFYAVMVIYLPLHLHNTLGFTWPEIGIILTSMLLPFVIVTYPLGWLADRKLGEKELLIAGFLLAGITTLVLAHTEVKDLWLWAILLFLTRVGAATIEIMKETYLFKKIDAKDVDILSLSRNLLPLAYVLAPLVASVILFFFPLAAVFTALGVITLLGVLFSLKLRDTK